MNTPSTDEPETSIPTVFVLTVYWKLAEWQQLLQSEENYSYGDEKGWEHPNTIPTNSCMIPDTLDPMDPVNSWRIKVLLSVNQIDSI